MIINNFNIVGVSVIPAETNATLPVYADAMLALTIAPQGFEPVTRRFAKAFKLHSRMNDQKFAVRCADQGGVISSDSLPIENLLCAIVSKAFNHKINCIMSRDK